MIGCIKGRSIEGVREAPVAIMASASRDCGPHSLECRWYV